MIHDYPKLEGIDQDVLGLIREQRRMLGFQVRQNPLRWNGFLRKNTFARALQGSNSIEGISDESGLKFRKLPKSMVFMSGWREPCWTPPSGIE